METRYVSTTRVKPRLNLPLAFIVPAFPELAGIPSKVIHVWPRFVLVPILSHWNVPSPSNSATNLFGMSRHL